MWHGGRNGKEFVLTNTIHLRKNLHNFCKADIISPVIMVICIGVHMYNYVRHYSMSISYVSVKFNPPPTSIKTEAKFENS